MYHSVTKDEIPCDGAVKVSIENMFSGTGTFRVTTEGIRVTNLKVTKTGGGKSVGGMMCDTCGKEIQPTELMEMCRCCGRILPISDEEGTPILYISDMHPEAVCNSCLDSDVMMDWFDEVEVEDWIPIADVLEKGAQL